MRIARGMRIVCDVKMRGEDSGGRGERKRRCVMWSSGSHSLLINFSLETLALHYYLFAPLLVLKNKAL